MKHVRTNRIGTAACIGIVAVLIATQGYGADATQSSNEGTDGAVPGAEKSVLSPTANKQADAKSIQDFCNCVSDADSDVVRRIDQALNGPLHSTGLDFQETSLTEVVSLLQDEYGIPIQLDNKAMEEIGIRSDEPVTVRLHKISLRSALRLILKNLQLTSVIEDEVLMITTPDEAEKSLRVCVYDVSSISGQRDAQLGDVIDTIVSCVATDTWAKNGGGQAEIRSIKPGMLVISQTAAVHEEIRNLLGTIRKMQAAPKQIQTATNDNVSSNEVVTRSYILQPHQTNDREVLRNQIRQFILESFPDETWNGRLTDGKAVTLTVINDRVVVRHTADVQDKVQKILTDSGIAMPAGAVAANSGGFGGGGFFRPSDRTSPGRMAMPGTARAMDPQPGPEESAPAGAANDRYSPRDDNPFNE